MVSNDDVSAGAKRYFKTSYNDFDDVASQGYKTLTFTPPVGYMWQIASMMLFVIAPYGATTGTHYIGLQHPEAHLLRGTSTYNSNILWDFSIWGIANSEKLPSTEPAALLALQNAEFETNAPLIVRYQNYTDVSSNYTRQYQFYIIETSIQK